MLQSLDIFFYIIWRLVLDPAAQIFSTNGTHPGMVNSRGRSTTPGFVGRFIFFDLQLARKTVQGGKDQHLRHPSLSIFCTKAGFIIMVYDIIPCLKLAAKAPARFPPSQKETKTIPNYIHFQGLWLLVSGRAITT